MRILMIGVNYSPEKTGIGPYTAGLSEHLAEQGHLVEVVTGLPSYPEWKVHDSYRRVTWRNDVNNGVSIHRRWHYVPNKQSAVHRLAYEATFLLSGCSAVLLDKPDLVLGVVPTLSGGVLARVAGQRFHAPYALLFQDLMGPAASQTGVSGANRVASLVTAVEGWIARDAAGIAVIAEGFRPHLESLGVLPDRICRVRNWTRIRGTTESRTITRKRLGWDHRGIVSLHSGNMGHKQGLENILECARLSQDRGEAFHFVLMGDGNQRAELVRTALRYQLKNLEFLPLQSDKDFPNVLAAADILLINQRGGVSEMALPSKLTSYLASGRPVIAAVDKDSETARELLDSAAGLVIQPDDPYELLKIVRELGTDCALRQRLGGNGVNHALAFLSRESALQNLEDFLTQLASTRR